MTGTSILPNHAAQQSLACSDPAAASSVVTRSVASLEETMQAFAVRAACFVGELDLPYSTAFDGRDFGASHLLARIGREPVGALRVRWFRSFAMPEQLAVMKNFRNKGIGRLLLENACQLAQERGCNILYCRAPRAAVAYFTRHGWASHEDPGRTLREPTVALTRSADPRRPSALPESDARALWDMAQPPRAALALPA